MRKIYSLLCAFMLSVGLFAQKGNLILSTPEVDVEYQIMSISSNGKWACGNINDGNYRGFLWDLTSGEVKELSAIGDVSIAMSVNNDGTIAGIFTTTENTPNNAPTEYPGYYKNGKWHQLGLETEAGKMEYDAQPQTISNDGKTIGGIGMVNGKYYPIIWIDGQARVIDDIVGSISSVSSDGRVAAGWTTHPKTKNRTACIWKTKETLFDEKVWIDTVSAYSSGPFNVCHSISENGKYALTQNRRYNIETGTSFYYTMFDKAKSFSLSSVDNNGYAYGVYAGSDGVSKAVRYDLAGNQTLLTKILADNGVDLSKYPTLHSIFCVSADSKSLGGVAYDAAGIPRSLVIKLDVDTTAMPPVSLKSQLFAGVNSTRLTWKSPLANTAALKGYNIYRNNEKLNAETVQELAYLDEGLADGTYNYEVKAVYEAGESESSESSLVVVGEAEPMAPRNLHAIQSSLNDVRLLWDVPFSSVPALNYYSHEDEVSSFGGGQYSFESAIRLRKEVLALYKKEGYQISDVSFMPRTQQNSWTVNIYEEGNMTPIYTEELSSANIRYGEENCFHLSSPVAIPEGKDIIVGIFVDVDGYGGYDVLGAIATSAEPGYSDLLRQAGQEEFFSIYDNAMNSASGSMIYNSSWVLSALFSKPGVVAEDVKEYKVYQNGAEVATTADQKYRLNNLEDGTYKFEVAAVYTNGKLSTKVEKEITVQQNTSIYKTVVPEVATSKNSVTATWENPVDDDESVITFASDNSTGGLKATASNQYSYMVATSYSGSKLTDYEDFQITGFRFYPLSDAEFSFILKNREDGDELVRIELERGVDYVLNRWNTIKLAEPIKLDRYSEYFLILDCYDVTPNAAPVGMDDQLGFSGISDLYSTDDGDNFLSLAAMGGKDGNWMLGLTVSAENPKQLPIEGYKVYVDNKLQNEELVQDTKYTVNDLSEGPHQLRVNPVYGNSVGEKRSSAVTFVIDLTEGINSPVATGTPVKVSQNASTITVEGNNVTGITAYDAAGRKVSQVSGNVLSISGFADGVYLLKVKADNKDINVKVSVVR